MKIIKDTTENIEAKLLADLQQAIAGAAAFLGGSFNAMVRSTAAVTVISSRGGSCNVLPSGAAMGVNVRLLEGDTIDSAKERIAAVIRDPGIKIEVMSGDNPSGTADTDCEQFRYLARVVGVYRYRLG